MTNIWEKAILNLAGNLNSGGSYLITTVHGNDKILIKFNILQVKKHNNYEK